MPHDIYSLIKTSWKINQLLSLSLELTYACELDCFFCYINRKKAGKQLVYDDYIRVLDDARKLNTLFLLLTGGEPTLHKDFFKIARAAIEKGFFLTVKTHASFKDSTIAEKLVELKYVIIDVSIHGADAAVHDQVTKRPGSFELLLKNLRILKKGGLRINLRCVITKENIHQMEQMRNLSEKLDIPIGFDASLSPKDNGDIAPLSHSCDLEVYNQTFELLYDAKPKKESSKKDIEKANSKLLSYNYYCGAASGTLAIDPYGDIYPRIGWKELLGSINKTTLFDFWNNSKKLLSVREENKKHLLYFLNNQGYYLSNNILYCPGRTELIKKNT